MFFFYASDIAWFSEKGIILETVCFWVWLLALLFDDSVILTKLSKLLSFNSFLFKMELHNIKGFGGSIKIKEYMKILEHTYLL